MLREEDINLVVISKIDIMMHLWYHNSLQDREIPLKKLIKEHHCKACGINMKE